VGILLLDRNLQRNVDVWQTRTDSSVNPVPADFYGVMSGGDDGTMVVNCAYAGTKNYPGGLASNKRVFPKLNDKLLQYVAMHLEFMWPAWAYQLITHHETDLKVCYKTRPNSTTYIRNVANFSVQWKKETGDFQIDHDPPGWVNCGFNVPDIAPDVWHALDFRYWYDPVALTFSIQSIKLDDDKYDMPAEHQNIPAQNTNWEEVANPQQQNEIFAKGFSIIQYDHWTIGWSDEPIGDIPTLQVEGEGFGVFLL
jgi:hypothetical protein